MHENEKIEVNFIPSSNELFSVQSKLSSQAIGQSDLESVATISVMPMPLKKKKETQSDVDRMFSELGKSIGNIFKQRAKPYVYKDFDTSDEEDEDFDDTPKYMKGRKTVDGELENYIKVKHQRISQIPIKSGSSRAKVDGLFFDDQDPVQKIAMLKFHMVQLEDNNPKLKKQIKKLKNIFSKQEQFLVRLYVLTGDSITPMSGDQTPNLYLKVEMGDQVVDDQERSLQKETQNPEFYTDYQFSCILPGPALLRIEIWEDNTFAEDELVGFTEIDCEDRFLNKKWCQFPLNKKPVETRAIQSEYGFQGIGSLVCFMEILPVKMKTTPFYNIKPPPRMEAELRIIVWQTQHCVYMDKETKCNDLFVQINPRNATYKQHTDTHYFCRNKGSFNWRIKYKMKLPINPKKELGADQLSVLLWDYDLIGGNELIGETIFNLSTHNILKKCYSRKKAVKLRLLLNGDPKKVREKIWLSCFKSESDSNIGLDAQLGKKQPKEIKGQVLISIEVLPMDLANQQKNGLGRSSPNLYPMLAQPKGRFQFDFFSPLKMLKKILGPDLYSKCWKSICCIICCVFCIYFWVMALMKKAETAALK